MSEAIPTPTHQCPFFKKCQERRKNYKESHISAQMRLVQKSAENWHTWHNYIILYIGSLVVIRNDKVLPQATVQ